MDIIYKVFSKHESEHLWTYEEFKEKTKAKLIDYSNTKNLINYIIYKIGYIVPNEVFERYCLDYEILNEFNLSSKTLINLNITTDNQNNPIKLTYNDKIYVIGDFRTCKTTHYKTKKITPYICNINKKTKVLFYNKKEKYWFAINIK